MEIFQTIDEFRGFLKRLNIETEYKINQIERYLKICLASQEDFYRKRAEDLERLKTIYERILNEIIRGE